VRDLVYSLTWDTCVTELVADYDLEIPYQLGKPNVVVDALSRKRVGVAPG